MPGIVASALTEPIFREPKFWLVKVQAIPLATVRAEPTRALNTACAVGGSIRADDA